MTPVRLSTSADRDVAVALDWYDARQPGLGTAFLNDLHRTLARIGRYPTAYARAHRTARRAPLSLFPYTVTYQASGDGVIVLAVIHSRQNPQRTLDRLDSR